MVDSKGHYASGGGGAFQVPPGPETIPGEAAAIEETPALTLSLSAVDDFLRNPNASARLIADLDEWCDSRDCSVRRNEPAEIGPGWYRALGGTVEVVEKIDQTPVKRRSRASGELWRCRGSAWVHTSCERRVRLLSNLDIRPLLGLFQTARYLREQTRLLLPDRIARHHHIWLHADPGATNVDLSLAAHLLASSIASQFGEAVLVIDMIEDDRSRITRHLATSCEAYGEVEGAPTESKVLEHIARTATLEAKFHHFLYVNLSAPERLHPVLPVAPFPGFDRIVHIGEKLDLACVRELERRLKEGARNRHDPASPMFTSFVATFVNGSREKTLRAIRPAGFDRMEPDPAKRPPGWRLLRDACWIDVDIGEDTAGHLAWIRRGSMDESLISRVPEHVRAAVDHWARAVTNRQVGVALSGGGASSYRFVPALQEFAKPKRTADGIPRASVPVDVVSGVSGGALIGAYYCAEGVAGCEKALEQGPELLKVLLTFLVSSKTLEWLIDARLGKRSIASLPTRFVPVAVCLMKSEPPETRILLDKTIGQSVRASGSLPIAFGPSVIDGESYSDGAFGAIIPTQAVLMHGADLVIAINCLAGPSLGLPFEDSEMFQFLTHWTPAGRLVDMWVSIAYLQQEATRLVARTEIAPFLIEPERTPGPFREMVWFNDARNIAAAARDDDTFMHGVYDAVSKWDLFRDFHANVRVKRENPTVAAAPPTPGNAAGATREKPMSDEYERSMLNTILTPAMIEALKEQWSRNDAAFLLEEEVPKIYPRAGDYFSAVVDTYYEKQNDTDDKGVRIALDEQDRQRVVIALQAATGQTSPLAIHIYIGLMLGITVDEVANILLLAGVYAGVPNFFVGLGTLTSTLKLLAALSKEQDRSVKRVLDSVRLTWSGPDLKMSPPAAAEGRSTNGATAPGPTPPLP